MMFSMSSNDGFTGILVFSGGCIETYNYDGCEGSGFPVTVGTISPLSNFRSYSEADNFVGILDKLITMSPHPRSKSFVP